MLGPDRPSFKLDSASKPKPIAGLTSEQALAVRRFVAQAGGLDNARRAIELLSMLRKSPTS